MLSPLMMEPEENNNGSGGGGGCVKKEKTAAEIRKSNKPLMERKRRERINNCLQQLKAILMDVTKKESSYYSKLEKADILEMTVKYLKNLKRQQLTATMGSDPAVLSKYIAGYNECTTEITKYLNSIDGLTTDTRTRLINHLANSLQRNSLSMATNTAVANLQLSMSQAVGEPVASGSVTQPLGIQIPAATSLSGLPGSAGLSISAGGVCVLNQAPSAIQAIPASAMQLVPARLPSGELVFLLANSSQTVSPQGAPMSVLSTVQNNVNNINIGAAGSTATSTITGPQQLSAVAQAQFAFPANISTVSPMVIAPKDILESPTTSTTASTSLSGASTSGSSPESDTSDLSGTMRHSMKTFVRLPSETPRRRPPSSGQKLCSPGTDSSETSDSDSNDDDIFNNNLAQCALLRGPMWRPW